MIRITPIKRSTVMSEQWVCDGCGKRATKRITAAATNGLPSRTLEFCERCICALAHQLDGR